MEPPKFEISTSSYKRFERWEDEQLEGNREGQAPLEKPIQQWA